MHILKCKTAMIIICHRIECCCICNPLCYGLQVELIMVRLMIIVTLLVRTHICLLCADWDRNFLQTKSYSKILPIITHLRDERFCWRCFLYYSVRPFAGWLHSFNIVYIEVLLLKPLFWYIWASERKIRLQAHNSFCVFFSLFVSFNIFHFKYFSFCLWFNALQTEREWEKEWAIRLNVQIMRLMERVIFCSL